MTESSSFYVTTPIYYVNDKPHIGHAYTTILADVLTRYQRLLKRPSYFLTGTDEHGQKVQRAAEANGITSQEQADRTVVRFQELWKRLDITNAREEIGYAPEDDAFAFARQKSAEAR